MPSPALTGCRRIGIYGGTFSPPHNGHVRAALAFLETARLDVLYVIPTGRLPHRSKIPDADSALRLAMTRAAFADADPRIRISSYEIESSGVSYTYRTLAHFAKPGSELFLLCGSDMFLTVDTWRCSDRIFSLATVAFVPRSNDPVLSAAVAEKEAVYRRLFGARTLRIPMEPLELSSNCIRQMVREGGDVTGLVPDGVYRLIRAHNLYRSDCV